MSNNPFGDLETEFEKADKAPPGASAGRIPVHNAYHGMCTTFETREGETVDKEYFETPAGTKAVRIMFEILEPDFVGDEEVKGAKFEHVFWVTTPNLPYVKRDASTILARDVQKLSELLESVWAGKTVEFGVRDELYNGFMRSKVTHFTPWAPEQAPNAGAKKDAKAAPNAGAKKDAKKQVSF